MRNIGVLGLNVARSEIDNFVQKDRKQTINSTALNFFQFSKYVRDKKGLRCSFLMCSKVSLLWNPFTLLWTTCADPHHKFSPIPIFTLFREITNNSCPKSPQKGKTKRKLHQPKYKAFLISSTNAREVWKRGTRPKSQFQLRSLLSVVHPRLRGAVSLPNAKQLGD